MLSFIFFVFKEIEIAASIIRKTAQTESTNTRLTPIQTNVEFVTDDPTTRDEINTKYMLAGGGIFLALFLFVIFLQLYTCKKTKLKNTKQLQQNICEERDTTDELIEDTQNEIQRTLRTSYRARNGDKLNALPQSVYDDIDESLEIRHTQSVVNESQKYEQHHLSTPNLSYSPLSFHRFNYQSDVPFIGPSDVNRSDLYLQPISVRKTADVDSDQITC